MPSHSTHLAITGSLGSFGTLLGLLEQLRAALSPLPCQLVLKVIRLRKATMNISNNFKLIYILVGPEGKPRHIAADYHRHGLQGHQDNTCQQCRH